jgi:two-component system cell cycle response regulator DivK
MGAAFAHMKNCRGDSANEVPQLAHVPQTPELDPTAAPTREPQAATNGTRGTNQMTKTVLIAEDNDLNLKLFNDLLQIRGYRTILVRDGTKVVETLRESPADLVLMDIQLPGISGLDITKLIKADEQLKNIPIIAVTAYAMKGDEQKIRDGGCDAYISKPITVPVFMELVTKFLE